jgi:hypothetical protein
MSVFEDAQNEDVDSLNAEEEGEEEDNERGQEEEMVDDNLF